MYEKKPNEAMLPTNDYVFKRIFGYKGKENITKSFIESTTNHKIKDIKVSQEKILEKDLREDKVGILDIYAIINDNTQCNIEMQMVKKSNIEKRILYYWSKMYSGSIKESESYGKAEKTIVILIANFELEKLKEIKKFHSKFELREEEYKEVVLTEVLEIHIIELPKILKKIEKEEIDKKDKLVIWSMFLINPEKIGGKEMDENKDIKEAKELYDQIQEDEHEKRLAELRLKYIMDQKATEEYGYECGLEEGKREGVKEGIKEGIKEGEKRKQYEIAKRMKEEKIEVDIIAKVTGLTEEEINKIL